MRYIILTTPRTGSHAICDLLAQTKLAGFKRKTNKIRHELRLGVGPGLSDIDYIKRADDWCFKHNTTANGVNAIKANWPYLLTLMHYQPSEKVIKLLLTADRFIYLHRGNKVAQGVSLYFAHATSRWHSDQTKSKKKVPPYNYGAIANKICRNAMGDGFFTQFINEYRVPCLSLMYEEAILDWQDTTDKMLDFLSLPSCTILNPHYKKMVDDRKATYIERYNAEHEDRQLS